MGQKRQLTERKINNDLNQLNDGQDLEQAFILWNEALYAYVYARLKNRPISEDLVQEVFVKTWKNKDSFDAEKSSLKNWFFVITINTLRDYYRKKKIEKVELEENTLSEDSLKVDYERKEEIEKVFLKLTELPERDQELILLRYKSDLTIEEVANAMEMEYSATKVAIHRAIKKLQGLCL